MTSAMKPRIRFRRRITSAAAVAALSVAGLLATSAPASAAMSDCPSGSTCLWKDADYATGGIGWNLKHFANGIRDFRMYNFDLGQGNLNDSVSSWSNNGNSQASSLFFHINFDQLIYQLPVKSGFSNLHTFGWGDQATSAGFSYCVANPTAAACI